MQATGSSLQTPERRLSRPSLLLTQSSSTSWDTAQSSTSWDTQTVVDDDDDDEDDERRVNLQVASQRKILPRDVSDRLEPFEAMPVKLDRFAESLVSFYLLQYPQATYVFNQNLNPHPVYTNFAIAMNAPACFQVILARSALYKKSAGHYGTSLEKAELETAVVEHKTNAIHRIRQLSQETKTANKDELIASIISMGTLEMRMGSTSSGDVHYSAVRRLLKDIGGPLNIRDLRLKRVMCFFECIYGTPRNSYIWDGSDFAAILQRFNEYLSSTWEIWMARSGIPGPPSHLTGSKTGFPFPSTASKSAMPTTARRKPTGPHSPYFGLQPLPEAVLQPKPQPPPTLQSRPRALEVLATALPSAASLSRAPKQPSSSSAKRPPRPPAKQRAKRLEKQKQRQSAMELDTETSDTALAPKPASATPQSQHPISIPDPPPVTSMAPPPPSTPKRPPSSWKLHPESSLHRRLSLWDELPAEKKTSALIWDLACLFCLSAIAADYLHDPNPKALGAYMSKLGKVVSDANLHVSENNSNLMWLVQTSDPSPAHNARMWEVASFTWVCKHLNVQVQRRLREWLFAYLAGGEVQRRIELSAFNFSYVSELV